MVAEGVQRPLVDVDHHLMDHHLRASSLDGRHRPTAVRSTHIVEARVRDTTVYVSSTHVEYYSTLLLNE